MQWHSDVECSDVLDISDFVKFSSPYLIWEFSATKQGEENITTLVVSWASKHSPRLRHWRGSSRIVGIVEHPYFLKQKLMRLENSFEFTRSYALEFQSRTFVLNIWKSRIRKRSDKLQAVNNFLRLNKTTCSITIFIELYPPFCYLFLFLHYEAAIKFLIYEQTLHF